MSHCVSPESAELELASVLECLGRPAVIVGQDHRIVATNRAYLAAFDLDRSPCGRTCFEVSHGVDSPCGTLGEPCPMAQALSNGGVAHVVHVHHTSRGPEHAEIVAHRLATPDGRDFVLETIDLVSGVSATSRGDGLVGATPVFNRVLDLLTRVGRSDATVLLLGESGTGKELAARTLHENSPRASRPFVPVDCSGLAETLFESELFGHERGAFTGATHAKRGLVESADGGTLFLDEVGDVPLGIQVKLLRLLETGVFRRVGSTELRRSDFRLVCATHRELGSMVDEGTFRRDLYYRISTFPIRMPPLREHPDDIPLLVDAIRHRLGCDGRCAVSSEALDVLADYRFPGNVRELRNLIERASLLADHGTIEPCHLPAEVQGLGGEEVVPESPCDDLVPLCEVEARYLRWAASRFEGTKRELAERLGVSERTLYRKLAAEPE